MVPMTKKEIQDIQSADERIAKSTVIYLPPTEDHRILRLAIPRMIEYIKALEQERDLLLNELTKLHRYK